MYVIATPHPLIPDLERSLQSFLQRGIRNNVLLIISVGIFLIWWWMMIITTITYRSDKYFVDVLYQIYISFWYISSCKVFSKDHNGENNKKYGSSSESPPFKSKNSHNGKNSRWNSDNLKSEGSSKFAFTVQYFCNTHQPLWQLLTRRIFYCVVNGLADKDICCQVLGLVEGTTA